VNDIELLRAMVRTFCNNNISQPSLQDASREKSQTYIIISCWFWPDLRCSLFGSACSRTVNHARRYNKHGKQHVGIKPLDTTVSSVGNRAHDRLYNITLLCGLNENQYYISTWRKTKSKQLAVYNRRICILHNCTNKGWFRWYFRVRKTT